MATDSKPVDEILDLDHLTNKPVVIINGTEYRLLTFPELSPRQRHRLNRLVTRGEELAEKPELTPEEDTELDRIPKDQCRIILKAPDAVIDQFEDDQAQAVLSCFLLELPEKTLLQRDRAAFKRRLSTGASGSPASAGSTAEAP